MIVLSVIPKYMKKSLLLAVFSLFLVATPVYAQSTSLQYQYISSLTSLISLLEQQVQNLENQLNLLVITPDSQVTQDIQQINQTYHQIASTTPLDFGSIEPQVDKEISWSSQPVNNPYTNGKLTVNYWSIQAFYTENGVAIPTIMTLSSDDGLITASNPQQTRCTSDEFGKKSCYGYTTFFASTTSAIITASANGITATTSINQLIY